MTDVVNWIVRFSSLILILFGVILLFISQGDEYWKNSPIIRALIRDLGSLLFVTGVLNVVWDILLKRKFLDEILEKTNLSSDIKKAKLIGVTDTFNYNEINWKEYFRSVKQLDIFFTYGSTWRGVHKDDLKTLTKRNCFINLILPDADDDNIIEELARRFSSTNEQVKSKIEEAKSEFTSLKNARDCQATIKIYYVKCSPQYTFYRFDEIAILAMYDHSGDKNPVPTLICQKGGSLFTFIEQDYKVLTDTNNVKVREV